MSVRVMRICTRLNIGGPSRQIEVLSNSLTEPEFEHRIYHGNCEKNEIENVDLTSHETCRRVPSLKRGFNLLDDLKALKFLVLEIRSYDPDIVHTHMTKAGLLGRLAVLISGRSPKIVHTFHGHLLQGYFHPLVIRLLVIYERLMSIVTDIYVSVGERVMEDLLAKRVGSLEKFRVIRPGIIPPTNRERSLCIHELRLSNETRYCSFVGRLTKIKRPDRFLEVVNVISSKLPNVRFLVAGTGELFDSLSSQVKEKGLPVDLLGNIDDISYVLGVSELLICTSDNEGTPIAIIESSMLGVPVVATNVGSTSEVVRHGITGYLVSNDVEKIAEAAIDLLKNDDLRRTMGKEARVFATNKFHEDILFANHKSLYESLVLQH